MSSKTRQVEVELLVMIQEWQERLSSIATRLETNKKNNIQRVRKGGVDGSTYGTEVLRAINIQLATESHALNDMFRSLIDSMCRTLDIRNDSGGNIASAAEVTGATIGPHLTLADFFAVGDGTDCPVAWWVRDGSNYYLGVEPINTTTMIGHLGYSEAVASGDIMYVEETEVATGAAGTQKGRRLAVAAAENDDSGVATYTHGGVAFKSVLTWATGVSVVHALRDFDLLVDQVEQADKKLVLRRTYAA